MKNKIWIVGMGPGKEEMMTGRAIEVLEQVDVIIGYTVYLDLLGRTFSRQGISFHADAAGRKTLQNVF